MSRTLVSLQNFRINDAEWTRTVATILMGLDLILQRRTERGSPSVPDRQTATTDPRIATPDLAHALLEQLSHKAQT